MLGLAYGFQALRIGDNRLYLPKLIGVQAHSCAPIWNLSHGRELENEGKPHNSLAEGVRVWNPVRIEQVLKEIEKSNGDVCVVEEDEILPARNALAQAGFYIEPTSAIVWPVLHREMEKYPDPIIVILTGSGYKSG